ncbi:14374_t:CDS:2 [Entrophospora sp. SA101]|nr:14374_t:CDS:2 [Entrophospora sp. SA101]
MEDAGSKISAKDAKRNKSSNQNIVVDAGQSTSDEFENIDKLTENIVNIEKKLPYVEQKMILSWKHVIEKITIDRNSDHDWIVNGYNISEDFRKFQTQAVELLKSNPSFSYATDVDQIFFLTLTSNDINHKMDEDTFAHRYLHLLLEEVFNTDDYKFVCKDNKKHEITYGEIKPPSTPNNVVNKALIKLAEFMKGSLDDIGNKPGFETFGILIDGFNVKLFSMDLNFNGVYCLNQIGKMILPTEHANFLTIIPVILNFYSLLKRVNHAIEKLNAPSTPTNQSYHRLSNSSPQKVISILKLPPPAALI